MDSKNTVSPGVSTVIFNHSAVTGQVSSLHNDTYVINSPSNDDFCKLQERVRNLEKCLCILYPNNTLHEKYPVLKEAYNEYRLIEKLIFGNEQ